MKMAENVELLFFDTFSHETSEELNLDLVQFPKPVFISEVRIIPLGARVQADFPGGVRLGATNPSQFEIEFFVNDLSKPGASTFESLGGLEYKQNGNIQLACERRVSAIPTDGLVLRGWYTTITLAVYGALTKGIAEATPPPAQPPAPSSVPPPASETGTVPSPATADWGQQVAEVGAERAYLGDPPEHYPANFPPEAYPSQEYPPSYPEQWNPTQPTPGLLPAPEGYDPPPNKEGWEGDKLPWERGKERGGGGGGAGGGGTSSGSDLYWEREWDDRQTTHRKEPGFRERDWPSGGRGGSWTPRHHQSRGGPPPPRTRGGSWEGEDTRKRPHTPPLEDAPLSGPSTPKKWPASNTTSPLHSEGDVLNKDSGDTTTAAVFESLSPGDVESISSEGDLPELVATTGPTEEELQRDEPIEDPPPNKSPTEGIPNNSVSSPPRESFTPQPHPIPSPPPTPEDPEQFEPILSDEDNMEDLDAQFQDVDFDDTEEPDRLFDPFAELQPLECLADPSLTEGEVVEWKLQHSSRAFTPPLASTTPPPEEHTIASEGERLVEIVDQWSKTGSPEVWVELAEQASSVVAATLPIRPETLPTLLQWVELGLDIEQAMAQPQPGFKVRHIKAGLRLAIALCASGCGALQTLIDSGLFKQLFHILESEHMALSLRLLAIRTLDASLRTKYAVKEFCTEKIGFPSGYQSLLKLLRGTTLARLQFAITSLVRKIHLEELLRCICDMTISIGRNLDTMREHDHKISAAIEEFTKTYLEAPLRIGQFRRFLPVRSQFEIPTCVQDPYSAMYAFMKSNHLLESLLVIFTHPLSSDVVINPSLDLLEALLDSEHGLRFLASNGSTTLGIIRALLTGESQDNVGTRTGMKLAYCMRAMGAIDQLSAIHALRRINSESSDTLEALRTLYCLGEIFLGRLCVAHVISRGFHIVPVIHCISNTRGALPGRCYAVDILVNSVTLIDHAPLLTRHGEQLKTLTNQEPRLTSLSVWLKVITEPSVPALCEILKQCEDKVGNLPSELISALRALRNVALPAKHEKHSEFMELKHRHALLELFSLDGVNLLATVLTKLSEAFDQPALHTSALLGPRGPRLVGILLPALSLLRAMLTLVANCQGSAFRNLTTVPALLSAYTLLHAFPHSSSLYPESLKARSEAVSALLAYTQPCPEEALPKSLWTQMLSEVIKHATASPNNFLPGMELLSSLLPLPLPINSVFELSDEETARVTSLRRLWGAHIHPLASAVHDMILLLVATSSSPLVGLLKKVCVQLADLDPNTALMVGRAILEPAVASLQADQKMARCSLLSTRRLNLLSIVGSHPAPKAALLQLLHPAKSEEEGSLSLLCWVLSRPDPTGRAQYSVAKLFAVLCDPCQASMWIHATPPPREILIAASLALGLHVAEASKHGARTLRASVDALCTIGATSAGLYYVKSCLESKERSLLELFSTCSTCPPSDRAGLLSATLALLKLCTEKEAAVYTEKEVAATRSLTARMVGWPPAEDAVHPITALAESTVENKGKLEALLKLLKEGQATGEELITADEPEPTATLAEPLATQFSHRTVICALTRDWTLPPIGCEPVMVGELERLDLPELAAAALPDLQLAQELGRISHMHRGEEHMRGGKAEGGLGHFQVRDRGMRRPFMLPMRGRTAFGRAMPVTRGDTFRSRPPNTSRPPSLHVDDFLALESAGQQPTGPTGYNKQTMRAAKELLVSRPRARGRASGSERGRFPSVGVPIYRRDQGRGLSRGIPPNLGRGGMGDGNSPGSGPPWPTDNRQQTRPPPPSQGDKMMWDRGGLTRREGIPRHPRTFSR